MRMQKIPVLLCLGVLITLVGGCDRPARRAARPNIILISIEATRPDHLSAYGYERQTSPFIDSLAATGVRFDKAYSVSSWTVPAVASLVTGTYPAKHRVLNGVVQNDWNRAIKGQEILSADLPHLARTLQAAGYRTFGVTANGHLAKDLGYGEGFDLYRNLDFKPGVHLTAEYVNEIVANWQGQFRRSEPYFLWVHYYDPHDNYHARGPWIGDYFPDYKPHRQSFDRLAHATPRALATLGIEPDSPRHACLQALYDSEINYADQAIGEMLELLKVDGDDLVIVTSDHGEEFLDHGGFGHASTLYEELVRVPLVFSLPGGGRRPVVQSTPVSLVDISPTILDYLHLEIPAGVQGQSLMNLMEGGNRPVHEAIWTTLGRSMGRRNGLLVGDWKLIQDKDGPALYNLARDPRERENLAADYPDKVKELQGQLEDMRRTYGSQRKAQLNTEGLSPEEIEKLRSLGYVR